MGQPKITRSTPELVNKGGAQGTCEDPAGPKMFEDVKWGVTNPLGSSANTPVFSNSSTTNQQALSRVAREIYSPNIISEATTFPGVVMRSEETKNSPRKPFLKRLFSLWKKRVGDLDMEFVYKVYMPHLECRGRPEDKDSPRINDYLDVFASAVAVGPNNDSGKQTTLQQIPDDTAVLVTFYDLEELSMPLIVEVVGIPPTLGFFSGFGDAFGAGSGGPAGSSRDQYRGGAGGGCGPGGARPGTGGGSNVIYTKLLPGAQEITSNQEIISTPPFPTALTSTVKRELTFWKGKKECDSAEAKARLNVYWENIGLDGTGHCTNWAWSAAYISYVIMQSDPSFGGSQLHTTYAGNAKKGVGAWTLWKAQPGIKAQIGDILMYPNKAAGAAAVASHGDVVYAVQGNKAYLAGGNLSDTSKGGRPGDSKETGFNYLTLNLDSSGYYSSFHAYDVNTYLIVLKKNGKVQNRTTGEVATAGGPGTPPSCGAGPDGSPSAPVEREPYAPSSTPGKGTGKRATYNGIGGGPIEVRNASLPPEILETVRFNGDEFVSLRDMIPDLLALKAKYEEVFKGQGHDLFRVNNSYRDYAWQADLYNKNCSGGTCSPPTARPGRSRHGWGAAVDLSSRQMFGGSTSSLKFRWLNKYGRQFNFVFSVKKESWHLNWIPVNTVLAGAGQPTGPWTNKGLDSGPANLRLASIDNPGGTTV